ncbi:MAG TPA: OmpA family protein [Candidatus Angelobacter sp.]|nr:OmpA family protein [Candidatus Angelobacter sp.]
MAVSQFLRPGSLLDAATGCLTPEVVHSASTLVGEPEASTRQTLNRAVPSVMNGLTNLVSSPNGANTLAGLIRDGGFGAAADNPQSLFSGGAATNNMLTTGSQLLGTIFGGRGAAVGDLLARSGGVSPASANKLLSLTAPLVLGVLGKKAAAQGLNSSGLANALLSEKSDIAAAAPAGLSKLLTAGPVAVPSATSAKSPEPASVQHWKETSTDTGLRGPMHLEHFPESAPGAAEPRRAGFGWLPLLLAGLAALGFLLFLRGRTPQPAPGARTTTSEAANTAATAAKDAVPKVASPSGAGIRVPQGSVAYSLALFLGDRTAAAPRTFVFDNLNFHTGTTQLTKPSLATINDLVVVLREYPDAKVQLVGHTDNTGRPEANQILSLNRANAVKNMLVKGGVGADRISTAGMGQDHPVASNDTEEGRARNRRLELNVTSK